jgi:hypothetical protein
MPATEYLRLEKKASGVADSPVIGVRAPIDLGGEEKVIGRRHGGNMANGNGGTST